MDRLIERRKNDQQICVNTSLVVREIPIKTMQDFVLLQKEQQALGQTVTDARVAVVKKEPSCIVVGIVYWYNHCANQYEDFLKF